VALASGIGVSYWHICQKTIAFGRIPVPSKHRVNTSLKLDAIRFVDIAYINPKVLQAIISGLLSAETDLVEPRLALSIPFYYILEGDLLQFLYV
jgi:hypothetical protein